MLHLGAAAASAECVPEVGVSRPLSGELLLQALPSEVVAELLSEGSAMQGRREEGERRTANGISQILVIFDQPRATCSNARASDTDASAG